MESVFEGGVADGVLKCGEVLLLACLSWWIEAWRVERLFNDVDAWGCKACYGHGCCESVVGSAGVAKVGGHLCVRGHVFRCRWGWGGWYLSFFVFVGATGEKRCWCWWWVPDGIVQGDEVSLFEFGNAGFECVVVCAMVGVVDGGEEKCFEKYEQFPKWSAVGLMFGEGLGVGGGGEGLRGGGGPLRDCV